jgi:transposase InsO family protein
LDSGASRHFTNSLNDFVEFEDCQPVLVRTATSSTFITGKGTVYLKLNDRHLRISPVYYVEDLSARLLSLGQFMQHGLYTRGSIREVALYDERTNKEFVTFHPRTEEDTIYVIKSLVGAEITAHITTIHSIDFEVMHRRMAHPSKEVLQKARKHTQGVPEIEIPREHVCSGCAQGKMTKQPSPPSEKRATVPFELIHSDLKTLPIESYQKFKYSIIFYDDHTSHAWTINLRTKDAALPAVKQFIKMVEVKYKSNIQKWMSDGGGEYNSGAFNAHLKERGIEIIKSIPHAHTQNGRAERIIRTLMDKAESMRFQACIPASWWQFSLDHATHVYNRTPSRRLNWQTPFQMLNKEKPNVTHLRVFGCAAYVFIPVEVRTNKMSPKSELMIYLGNHPGGKGWIFMRGPNNIVFSAAQATFDESLFPRCPHAVPRKTTRLQLPAPINPSTCQNDKDCQCPHSGPKDDDEEGPSQRQKTTPKVNPKGKGKASAPLPPQISGEGDSSDTEEEERDPEQDPLRPPTPEQPLPPRARKVPNRPGNIYGQKHPVEIEKQTRKKKDWEAIVGTRSSRPVRGQGREPIPGPSAPPPPPPEDDDDEDEETEEESEGSGTNSEDEIEESLETDPAPPGGLDTEYSYDDLFLTRLCREGGVALSTFLISKAVSPTAEEKSPKEWTYRDILKLPQSEHGEWRAACERELETLRKRSVYDLVERPRGRKVIKNRWVFDIKTDGRKRARLVAKGFSQVEGLDYDQVFSPVVRFETVRLILAMAALEKWILTGLDVRNAYLYGELDEEIYMEQPEGFPDPVNKHHVLRLRRALYGLKQAGLAWWRALKLSMEQLGFISLSSDAGIFLYRKGTSFVIAVIYVDDAIFTGPDKDLVFKLKAQFMERWEVRDLGDVTEFLRMRITRVGDKIHLDQTDYLKVVLQRCGMQNAKTATTPLPAGYVTTKSLEQANPERRSRYQTVIGSLLYLMLGTRPDIAFAVTQLAQHAANPTEEHLNRALYICRYLVATPNYRLTYNGGFGEGISACTDSDWASNVNNRRSQTGFFVKMAGGLISWTSRAQKTIALSSTEAEYMALSDCSRQVVWMHTLLGELGYHLKPIPICGDNQGSIFMC